MYRSKMTRAQEATIRQMQAQAQRHAEEMKVNQEKLDAALEAARMTQQQVSTRIASHS